jgi:hypothetical protein
VFTFEIQLLYRLHPCRLHPCPLWSVPDIAFHLVWKGKLQKGHNKRSYSLEKQEIGRGEFYSLYVFCSENSLNLLAQDAGWVC